jgi:hypothetical protein
MSYQVEEVNSGVEDDAASCDVGVVEPAETARLEALTEDHLVETAESLAKLPESAHHPGESERLRHEARQSGRFDLTRQRERARPADRQRLLDEKRLSLGDRRGHDARVLVRRQDRDDRTDGRVADEVAVVGVEMDAELRRESPARRRVLPAHRSHPHAEIVAQRVVEVARAVLSESDQSDG